MPVEKERLTELLASGETRTFSVNSEARVLNLLANFQLVEFALKVYLGYCYEIVRKRVEGVIPFHRDFKSIEKHALKRLIELFVECNSNRALQRDLFKLSRERDELAHRSLLGTFGISKTDADPMGEHRKLSRTEVDLSRAMKRLAREIVKVKADLDLLGE
jgi:hypothetical protein